MIIEFPTQQKKFRFNKMWLSDNRHGETVEAAWRQSLNPNSNSEVLNRVKQCGKDLRTSHGGIEIVLVAYVENWKQRKKMLVQAENTILQGGNNLRLKELKAKINVLLERKAPIWSQRSHVLWVSQGDNNKKYFHS